MARFRQSRAGAIGRLLIFAISLTFVKVSLAAAQNLYEYPTIVADPGLHTGVIRSAAVDSAGRFVVTGSEDKTIRVWSLSEEKWSPSEETCKRSLLQTIRMPSGPGLIGKVFAVAMSPKGDLIAVGGWTSGEAGDESVYLFDLSGSVRKRIAALPDVAIKLVFSVDARYLAVALGDNSLHIYDGRNDWTEIFRDTSYRDEIWGMAFAPDDRFATASHDGKVRLYDSSFRLLVPPKETEHGKTPHQVAFSPNGNKLAVGYADAAVVDILAGDTLQTIEVVDAEGYSGRLPQVAWSRDGETLFAGAQNVHAWTEAGRGQHRILTGGNDTLMSLNSLPDGGLLIATADPLIKIFGPDDTVRGECRSRLGDPNRIGMLRVSADGTIVDFGSKDGGVAKLRFDLRDGRLSHNPADSTATAPPKLDGVQIERRGDDLFLEGQLVPLDVDERLRSWAVSPDGRRIVIGGTWSLRSREVNKQALWRRDGPGAVWAVNIAGNNRLVVASYDDGTIRWHDMDSGQELLALMVLPTEKIDWVAWTPEGFYSSTAGGFGVLQWHINNGRDSAGTTLHMSGVPRLNRPEFLPLAVAERGVSASQLMEAKAAREETQKAVRTPRPPGARLHLLAVGVSQYGEASRRISLQYADQDAKGVVAALFDTHDMSGPYRGSGGLYAEVKPTLLTNETATRRQIFIQLAAMERVMSENDTAIIMFSGHGTMIGKQFYLLPYDADTTDQPGSIRASGISTTDFLEAIEPLTHHGRVLVLIDACHSGAFIQPSAEHLRNIIGAGNLTVLASSKGTQTSREDKLWQHGAFTKIFLDALSASPGSAVDPQHRGVLTMGELISYMEKRLPPLSGHSQELVVSRIINADLFALGM